MGLNFTACELCGFLGLLEQYGPFKASMLTQVFVTEHCTPPKQIAEDIVQANIDKGFGLHMLSSAFNFLDREDEINERGMAVCLYADQLAKQKDFKWLQEANGKLGTTTAAYGVRGQHYLHSIGLERLFAAEGVRILSQDGHVLLVATDSTSMIPQLTVPQDHSRSV